MVDEDGGRSEAEYTLSLTGGPVEIKNAEIDANTARAVVDIVMGGRVDGQSRGSRSHRAAGRPAGTRRSRQKAQAQNGGGARRRGSLGIVKELSMRPQGKKSLGDFVKEKQPRTQQQRQVVAIYWLQHEAGMEGGITVDHINTCYQHVGWSRPANLHNALSVTANKKGWLDPSDRGDIKLTVHGEDFVRHELPIAEK